MLTTEGSPILLNDGVRAAADAVRARAALRELREAAESLRRTADRCKQIPQMLRDQWAAYEATSPAGTPESFAPVFQSHREVIVSVLAAVEAIGSAGRELSDAGVPVTGVDEDMRTTAAELTAILAGHDKLWTWLNKPMSGKFDEDLARRSREAYARGEYEDIEDIIRRLQAGGEL